MLFGTATVEGVTVTAAVVAIVPGANVTVA